MVDGPLDKVKGFASNVADSAWTIAGAVVGVGIAAKGVEMVVGSADSGGYDSGSDGGDDSGGSSDSDE